MTEDLSPYRDTDVPECRRRTHRLERMRALIELWSEEHLPPFRYVLGLGLGATAVCLAPWLGSIAAGVAASVVVLFTAIATVAYVASGGAPR
jgi:cytochrome c biogenesis protein CcdA